MTGTAAFRPIPPSRAEWFGRSGLCRDADTITAPRDYALHLIRYIRDDSTVRARVADRFGRAAAPSREWIAGMRAQRDERMRDMAERMAPGEPTCEDRFDFVAWARGFSAPSMRAAEADARKWAREESRCMAARSRIRRAREIEALASERREMTRGAVKRGPKPMCAGAGGVIGQAEGWFGLDSGTVTGSRGDRRVIRARYIAAGLLRARGNSWTAVGAMLGGRDHSTAINLVRKLFIHMPGDADLREAWQAMAPCVIRTARSYEELNLMAVRQA